MAMKKVVALSILPFPKNVPAHDLWIGVASRLMGFKIYFSLVPAILYRRHGRTSSLAGSFKRRKLGTVLLDRLNLIVALIKCMYKILCIRYQSKRFLSDENHG
jgi:hypothetical protein